MSLNLDSLPSVWLLPDSPQREPRVGRFECSNQGGKSKIEDGSTNHSRLIEFELENEKVIFSEAEVLP